VVLEEGFMPQGKSFNSVHFKATREVREQGMLDEEGYFTQEGRDHIADRCEAYLDAFPQVQQYAILRAAYASAYLGEEAQNDGAAWTLGKKTAEGRAPGVAQRTLEALREVGVIGDIVTTSEGIVLYQGPPAKDEPAYQTAQIRDVWYHTHRVQQSSTALSDTIPDYAAIDAKTQKTIKKETDKLADLGRFAGVQLGIETIADGTILVRSARNGEVMGKLYHLEEPLQDGDLIELKTSRGRQGILTTTYQKISNGEDDNVYDNLPA